MERKLEFRTDEASWSLSVKEIRALRLDRGEGHTSLHAHPYPLVGSIPADTHTSPPHSPNPTLGGPKMEVTQHLAAPSHTLHSRQAQILSVPEPNKLMHFAPFCRLFPYLSA